MLMWVCLSPFDFVQLIKANSACTIDGLIYLMMLINYWWLIYQLLMDWSIDGLTNQWIDQLIIFFKNIFLHFSIFFNFLIFKKISFFSTFYFKKKITLELFTALYSSRTLGMQKKYLLSIEGSILSWWKGEVDGALYPWSCLFFILSDNTVCLQTSTLAFCKHRQ